MDLLGAIHLSGAFDVRIGAQSLLDEALKPLFAFGLTLYSLHNEAVR
jgi:hypothetical protein